MTILEGGTVCLNNVFLSERGPCSTVTGVSRDQWAQCIYIPSTLGTIPTISFYFLHVYTCSKYMSASLPAVVNSLLGCFVGKHGNM